MWNLTNDFKAFSFIEMRAKFLFYCIGFSKTWTVFSRSEAGIVGSNPTQSIDVFLCLFCVCIDSGLAMGRSPVKGVLSTVLGLRNWSETKSFTGALCSKMGATRKRERERASYSEALHYCIPVYLECRWFILLFLSTNVRSLPTFFRFRHKTEICMSLDKVNI
jgi:hypothetical protein